MRRHIFRSFSYTSLSSSQSSMLLEVVNVSEMRSKRNETKIVCLQEDGLLCEFSFRFVCCVSKQRIKKRHVNFSSFSEHMNHLSISSRLQMYVYRVLVD
mmetsp:Transcript_59810/g.67744  ORF Transcript_59810/g.67744 Transcript_59810/m.67744 type:complete len:99 (+) Transcript_59810:1-297(+)